MSFVRQPSIQVLYKFYTSTNDDIWVIALFTIVRSSMELRSIWSNRSKTTTLLEEYIVQVSGLLNILPGSLNDWTCSAILYSV